MERAKKGVKRKVDEIPKIEPPKVVTPTKSIAPPAEKSFWSSNTEIKGSPFDQLFSFEEYTFRPIWNKKGLGAMVFERCKMKVDLDRFKAGQTLDYIVIDFTNGGVEFIEEASSYKSVVASLSLGLGNFTSKGYPI